MLMGKRHIISSSLTRRVLGIMISRRSFPALGFRSPEEWLKILCLTVKMEARFYFLEI